MPGIQQSASASGKISSSKSSHPQGRLKAGLWYLRCWGGGRQRTHVVSGRQSMANLLCQRDPELASLPLSLRCHISCFLTKSAAYPGTQSAVLPVKSFSLMEWTTGVIGSPSPQTLAGYTWEGPSPFILSSTLFMSFDMKNSEINGQEAETFYSGFLL